MLISARPPIRTLKDEIESWRGFAWALRAEDKVIFERMLQQVWAYQHAIEASEKCYAVKPFFLTLLLLQRRMIEWLRQQLAEPKGARVRAVLTQSLTMLPVENEP